MHGSQTIQKLFTTYMAELEDISGDPSQFTGTTTITRRQWQDWNNNFHVQRLNLDWAARRGFYSPRGCGLFEPGECTGEDLFLAFFMKNLMYWTQSFPNQDRETWIYLTETARPSVNEWDAAFDQVIMRSYTDSSASAPALHFMNCNETGAFTCTRWLTRAPALVHFVIGDEPVDPRKLEDSGIEYDQPLEELRPVTAQIIEFPLEEAYLGLPSQVFPSPAEQMLAVVYGGVSEQFDDFNVLKQYHMRMNDQINAVFTRKGTAIYYFTEFTDWWRDDLMAPLGLKAVDDYAGHIAFNLVATTSAISFFIYIGVAVLANSIFEQFFSTSSVCDVKSESANPQRDNFWAGINDEAWSASLDRKQRSAKAEMMEMIASMGARHRAAEAALATTTTTTTTTADKIFSNYQTPGVGSSTTATSTAIDGANPWVEEGLSVDKYKAELQSLERANKRRLEELSAAESSITTVPAAEASIRAQVRAALNERGVL